MVQSSRKTVRWVCARCDSECREFDAPWRVCYLDFLPDLLVAMRSTDSKPCWMAHLRSESPQFPKSTNLSTRSRLGKWKCLFLRAESFIRSVVVVDPRQSDSSFYASPDYGSRSNCERGTARV